MSLEALETLAPGATFPVSRSGARNPANVSAAQPATRSEAPAANGPRLAAYVEMISLACVIAAVAGVLPLVMMLHR